MPTPRGKLAIAFTGIEQLSRQLARDGEVWQRVQQAAVRGMTENTEDLLGRSMRDAPVDEGTLRASGTAEVHERGFAVVGEVGFNTPYALVQHERLDFNHPKGGKAKYLEDNLKQQAGRYQENLNDHLRRALS